MKTSKKSSMEESQKESILSLKPKELDKGSINTSVDARDLSVA